MISKDRIVLMSRAAILQQQNSREMETNKYYRKEYVVSHFLTVWLYVTIVFAIVAAAIAVLFIEEYPKEAQNADWMFLLVSALMIYILIVLGYVLICLIVYSMRYGRSQQVVKQYNSIIKQIDKVYSEEEAVIIQSKISAQPAKKVKKKVKNNDQTN